MSNLRVLFYVEKLPPLASLLNTKFCICNSNKCSNEHSWKAAVVLHHLPSKTCVTQLLDAFFLDYRSLAQKLQPLMSVCSTIRILCSFTTPNFLPYLRCSILYVNSKRKGPALAWKEAVQSIYQVVSGNRKLRYAASWLLPIKKKFNVQSRHQAASISRLSQILNSWMPQNSAFFCHD